MTVWSHDPCLFYQQQFSLALYCHAANQTTTALRLLYRVRYLLLLITGPDHPEVANCDVSASILPAPCYLAPMIAVLVLTCLT